MTTVMQDDTVVAGKASATVLAVGEVSVDSRVAEALDIRVGSELVMSIVGREFTLRVVQLRRTTRNAIKPFFFFQLAAEQFVDAPRSYFSVHRFDTIQRPSILKTISERVGPHLSFIEVDGIIAQVEELLQAVAWSILLVFSSVVICGAVLLLLCFLTLTQEHDRDMKLLQMLGVRADFLHRSRVAVTLYPLLFSLLCSIVVVVALWICLRVLQDALPFSLASI
jgi:putative ABC transport system permease protein